MSVPINRWPPPAVPPATPRLQIDLSVDNARLDSVIQSLGDILTRLRRIELKLDQLGVSEMAKLTDVTERLNSLLVDVSAEKDQVSSMRVLMDGQTAQLTELRTELADAVANNDPAALQGALDTLDAIAAANTANRDAITAAVVANTPAAPAAPPAAPTTDPTTVS
jgi:hypothetical protein